MIDRYLSLPSERLEVVAPPEKSIVPNAVPWINERMPARPAHPAGSLPGDGVPGGSTASAAVLPPPPRFYVLRGERLRLVCLGGGRYIDATGTPAHCRRPGYPRVSFGPGILPVGSTRSPRNALLARPDGSLFVRPFRGLRRAA